MVGGAPPARGVGPHAALGDALKDGLGVAVGRGGGDDEGSQAQPIWSVIHLIRQHSAKFGPGFKVWIDK